MSHRPLSYWWLKLVAMVCLTLGRRERALTIFDEMLRCAPKDGYALASQVHLLAQMGRSAQALAMAQSLVQAHPQGSAGHWFNLAFLLDEADRMEEAEAAFRQAVQLDEELDRAWYGLGLVLIRLKRFDEAVEALKRNTELQPMSPYGWYQLARVHVDRQHPEEPGR